MQTRSVPTLGHSWGAWVVVTEPTPASEGLRRRECARCDAFEEEILPYSGEANLHIQFVVSGDMHYAVHLSGEDYEIYGRCTPALLWYDNVALTFDVVTHAGWGDRDVIVSVNGEQLAPNGDGSYTIPGGTGYVQVNAYPVASPADGSGSGVCDYCGKVHPGNLWGRIIAFFHMLFAFFQRLFNR